MPPFKQEPAMPPFNKSPEVEVYENNQEVTPSFYDEEKIYGYGTYSQEEREKLSAVLGKNLERKELFNTDIEKYLVDEVLRRLKSDLSIEELVPFLKQQNLRAVVAASSPRFFILIQVRKSVAFSLFLIKIL